MSDSNIQEIKARLDIVELVQSYTRLAKAGINYKALCPFHREKTPSFIVSPTRQRWHCFGCGKGGSHIDFIMEIEGLDFRDALELLARRAGIELRREDPRLRSERARLMALLEDAAKFYQAALDAGAARSDPDIRATPPRAYLTRRGLTDGTIRSFRIGYAPDAWDILVKALAARGYKPEELARAGLAVKSEKGSYYDRFRNRIMFPIADASGRVVGFGGRIFDEHPNPKAPSAKTIREGGAKYINTPQTVVYDKSRVLYGFDRAKDAIRRENAVVLVEGYMDLAMSHQAGITNAVAVSGTALGAEQLKILKRLAGTIISSFDRDAAGERATKRSLDLAATYEFERKAALLPDGLKDPADAVARDPEIWRAAVADAKPVVEFFLGRALARHDRTAAAGRKAIAHAVLPEIKILASEVERAHWIQTLARAIGIEESALWKDLARTRSADAEAAEADAHRESKTRRSQLESLFLGAILLDPAAGREHLAALPRHVIANDTYRRIFELIADAMGRNGKDAAALLDEIPDEFKDTCRHLAFQAEVLLERIENERERSRELLVCMSELEREWARERMQGLAGDITRAEQAGESERLRSLLAEFAEVSKKIQ